MTKDNPEKPKEDNSVKSQFRKRDIGYAFYKAFRRLTQVFLVFVIIFLLGVSALWLRLQSGPIDLSFVQDKIVDLTNEQLGEYQVNLDKISLTWLNVRDPFVMQTDNLEILQNGYPVTTVENVTVGLSPTALMRAKIRPSFLKISNPEVKLTLINNEISLCCVASEQSQAVTKGSEINISEDDLKQKTTESETPTKLVNIKSLKDEVQDILDDILNDSFTGSYAFFQNLNAVQFENVSVIILEDGKEPDSFAAFDLELRESGNSLVGSFKAQINHENQPAKIDMTIVYRGDQKDVTFMGDVQNLSSDILDKILIENKAFIDQKVIANGQITAAFNDEWKLSLAQLDVNIPEGKIKLYTDMDEPLDVKNIILKSYYNRAEETLNIDEFSGVVNGINLSLEAKGTRRSGEINLPVSITVPSIAMKEISDLIPPIEEESGLSWPKNRLSNGSFSDVNASFDLSIIKNKETRKRELKSSNIKADFAFKDMTIQYAEGLEPAANADGTGTYENDRLVIKSNKANIKDVTANNVVVDLKDLTAATAGEGSVKIKAIGPLRTILNYIADEPIGVTEVGFDKVNASGSVDADIAIDFPLKKDVKAEEFNVSVTAVIKDALLPSITAGLPITGGPYDVTYKDSQLVVEGSGQLATRPITFKWDQNVNSGTATLTADVTTDNGLRKVYGIDLEEYVSGPIPVQLVYQSQKDRQTFDVKADIKSAKVNLDALDYSKDSGVQGTLALKGLIENDVLREIDGLTINAENLSVKNGRVLFTKDKILRVSRGQFKDVTVNDNKLSAEFEVTNDNSLKIVVKSDLLDAKPFFAGEKTNKVEVSNDSTRPQQISIEAKKLLLKNDIAATNARIYVATNSAGKLHALEMDAIIGKGNTVLRFKPESGTNNKRVFVEAEDAGMFLKAAGLYKNVRGGFLSIKGQPVDNTSDIIGKARIDNFRVKDAPIVAKLINTMSLTGIMKLLSDEGLTFTRLESDFEWRLRPQGDLIIVKDGRSSGSSLGLTFEGLVNRETRTIDLAGNVIPMSEVNNIIGDIPLIGEILTGGDALLAATYKIEGPVEDPKVIVNPLAALAPGFLRKILFEEDVEKKIKKAE